MRDNEYVQHPLRPLPLAWAVLNSQHLIVLASMIPKDQKNITTLKWSTGLLFTAATRHLIPAVVKYKIWKQSDPSNICMTTFYTILLPLCNNSRKILDIMFWCIPLLLLCLCDLKIVLSVWYVNIIVISETY
jgi:hypothetical protein